MYRTSDQNRAVSAAGAAIIVSLIGYVLATGLMDGRLAKEPPAQALEPITLAPPIPKPKPPPPPPTPPKRAHHGGARPASHPSTRHEAAPAPAPTQPAPLPTPLKMSASPLAGEASGASAGSGGAGSGAGTGSGQGSGEGEGDGGGSPPELVKGRLGFDLLPRAMREAGVSGRVVVRYDVNEEGRVENCSIYESSGNPDLDRITCDLIERRFRYRPALDAEGRPVRAGIEAPHHWEPPEYTKGAEPDDPGPAPPDD